MFYYTWAGWLLKVGLAALLVAAALPKLADPAAFTDEVANYQIFPHLAPWVAAVLPGVELVLAAALVLFGLDSRWLQAAGLATGALMLMFSAAVGAVLLRGIDISCGCFGADSGAADLTVVIRNVLLMGACGLLVWISMRIGGRRRTLIAA